MLVALEARVLLVMTGVVSKGSPACWLRRPSIDRDRHLRAELPPLSLV